MMKANPSLSGPPASARKLLFLLPLLLGLSAFSCSSFREDRCYLEDERYDTAREIFLRTGSADLVRRRLREFQWSGCEIREAMYRLSREFEVTD